MTAIVIDAYASHLEYGYRLDAFCSKCQRWSMIDLAELVAQGRGGGSPIGWKPRCRGCGSLAVPATTFTLAA